MPYIKPEERLRLNEHIISLTDEINRIFPFGLLERAGRFNYVVTRLIQRVFPQRKYWAFALVCGILVTILLEFYRRIMVPYEELKIHENGDAYEVYGDDT